MAVEPVNQPEKIGWNYYRSAESLERWNIMRIREYFDLLTVVEAGVPHRLYSG